MKQRGLETKIELTQISDSARESYLVRIAHISRLIEILCMGKIHTVLNLAN